MNRDDEFVPEAEQPASALVDPEMYRAARRALEQCDHWHASFAQSFFDPPNEFNSEGVFDEEQCANLSLTG